MARPTCRVKDFKISAPLNKDYRDGDFQLGVTMKLSDNSIGNRLQLKLMDGNELYFQ